MESSDERATDRLIAERTLALAEEQEPGASDRRAGWRGFVAAAVALLLVVVPALVWVFLIRSAPASVGARSPGQPAEPPSGAPERDVGYLSCNAWPTATVYLDGKRLLGTTPIAGARVAAGAHTLVLHSKDGALRKEVSVNIVPGQTRTLSVALER